MHQALGALLLFVTNVVAILATGTVVMAIYGVWRMRSDDTMVRASVNRGSATAVIIAMVVLVGIPLTLSSVKIARDTYEQTHARDAARRWADGVGWELTGVDVSADKIIVRFEGPTPLPSTDDLRDLLRAEGIDPAEVTVQLLPRQTIDLGP